MGGSGEHESSVLGLETSQPLYGDLPRSWFVRAEFGHQDRGDHQRQVVRPIDVRLETESRQQLVEVLRRVCGTHNGPSVVDACIPDRKPVVYTQVV